MRYPIEISEIKDFYRVHIGKEPNSKISILLGVIVSLLNQAYADGVRDGAQSK